MITDSKLEEEVMWWFDNLDNQEQWDIIYASYLKFTKEEFNG